MVVVDETVGAVVGINKWSSSQQAARGFPQQQQQPSIDAGQYHLKSASKCIDQDFDVGCPERTGIGSTVSSTASWRTVMPVIGVEVLSLPWAIGQLGWVAGPVVMFLFSFVKYYNTALLPDCYVSGDHPVTSKRMQIKIYRFIEYLNVLGDAIGFTTAASICMMAIKRANCFHEMGHKNSCDASSKPYIIAFGVVQILFSQIPDFDQIWWLSILTALMSSTYSAIGLGLVIAKTVAKGGIQGSITGISVGVVTPTEKAWRSFQAFGKIAFAYSFSNYTITEIHDTTSSPPSETYSKRIKKATLINVVAMTTFYMMFGCMGYAAFGDMAPDNLFTGFVFYEPFWLLDIANAAIVLHLIVAYQVYCQSLFAFIEKWAQQRWPDASFVTKEYHLRLLIPCGNGSGSGPSYSLNLFRLLWRATFVVLTTVVSMLLPFFNDVAGFAGALGFWPLTVYYPVKMYVRQKKIPKWSSRWVCLQLLSVACLIISVAVAAGSVVSIVL